MTSDERNGDCMVFACQVRPCCLSAIFVLNFEEICTGISAAVHFIIPASVPSMASAQI